MKNVFPDYLPLFHCIASDCRHSCCIGWEIDVDPASLERCRAVKGALGEKLKQNIEQDEDGAHFRLNADERCPFLDENNLCEIIKELGEDALCDICADHPRFRNFYSGLTETGLGLCCEEAARLILGRQTAPKLECDGDEEGCEPAAFEKSLFRARDGAIAALNRSGETLDERLAAVLKIFGAGLPVINENRIYDLLFPLERLDPEWNTKLDLLLTPPAPDYPPELEVPFTRLAEYFLFRHLGGAAEDGRVRARAVFCALGVMIIRRIMLASPDKSFCSLCDTARLFSSEIEYSDINLDALFDFCETL